MIASLPASERKVVQATFERGFYWSHAENILLAMIASDDQDIRARGDAKILAIRNLYRGKENKGKRGKRGQPKGLGQPGCHEQMGRKNESIVRTFEVPKPIYLTTSYINMIDWEKEQVCPPPYLRDFSDEQVRQFENEPLMLKVASNMQHVERFIQLNAKLGTKAASSVARISYSIVILSTSCSHFYTLKATSSCFLRVFRCDLASL